MLVGLYSALGLLLLVVVPVSAHLLNAGAITPSVCALLVAWAVTHRDLYVTVTTALLVGLAASTLLGDGRGAWLLALLGVVALLHTIDRGLHLRAPLAVAGLAVVASLAHDLLFASLLALLEVSLEPFATLLLASPATALATGALALPVYAGLRVVEPLLRVREEHHGIRF